MAPCLLSQCQIPLAKCVLNPNCAANLTCIIACSGQQSEKECQIKCGDNFENDVVTELGRGDDTVGNPRRAQIYKFELFELILLLELGN